MHQELKHLEDLLGLEGAEYSATEQDSWTSVYLGSDARIPRIYSNRIHRHALEWWHENNGLVCESKFGKDGQPYMSRYIERREGALDGIEIVSEVTIPFHNTRTQCRGAVMFETYDPDAFLGAFGVAELQAINEMAQRVADYLGFSTDQEPPLIVFPDEVLTSGDFRASALQVVTAISDRVMTKLKVSPQSVHDLSPREFEQLIARLLLDDGHKIFLTPAQKDGGRDIIALTEGSAGTFTTIVECKKWRSDRPVRVDIVRGVYGALQQQRASHAMIVTTSRFTRDAQEFRDTVRYQLSLRDFEDVTGWLAKHG